MSDELARALGFIEGRLKVMAEQLARQTESNHNLKNRVAEHFAELRQEISQDRANAARLEAHVMELAPVGEAMRRSWAIGRVLTAFAAIISAAATYLLLGAQGRPFSGVLSKIGVLVGAP